MTTFQDPNNIALEIKENNKTYIMKFRIRGANVIGIGITTGKYETERNYYGEFTLEDLRKINKVFILQETIGDAEDELAKCVKMKECSINDNEDYCHIIYYLKLGTDPSDLSIALPRNEEPRIIALEAKHLIFKVEEDAIKARIGNIKQELDKIRKDQDDIQRETQTLNGEADRLLASIPTYEPIPVLKKTQPTTTTTTLRAAPPKPAYQPPAYVPPPSNNYPNGICRDIIRNENEIEPITEKIKSKTGYVNSYRLLYKGTQDTDSCFAFHQKCDNAAKTLVLVEDAYGHRFGGFTTASWAGENEKKYDDNAFVFKLDNYGATTYDVKPGEPAIAAYKYCGPAFCGCQIRIFDNFQDRGGSTYKAGVNYQTSTDFELTDGNQNFNVKDVEVYEVN